EGPRRGRLPGYCVARFSRLRVDETPRAVVGRAVLGEGRDLDARAAVRRVDEAPVADVHADVPETAEEHEVAGPQRAARDAAAEAVVRVRAMRQVDAEALVDVADEAGAVEAAGARAAPLVRDADEPLGERDGALAERTRPRRRDPEPLASLQP